MCLCRRHKSGSSLFLVRFLVFSHIHLATTLNSDPLATAAPKTAGVQVHHEASTLGTTPAPTSGWQLPMIIPKTQMALASDLNPGSQAGGSNTAFNYDANMSICSEPQPPESRIPKLHEQPGALAPHPRPSIPLRLVPFRPQRHSPCA